MPIFSSTKRNIDSYQENSGHIAININNSGQSKSIYFLAYVFFCKMEVRKKVK